MAAGCPPVRLTADGLPGGFVRCGSESSSQYLSALLMVAPYARREVRVYLDGPQTSWPYVEMTMQLMDRFGVTVELVRDPRSGEPQQVIVPHGVYHPIEYAVEPDASNASYFLAAAAVHPGATVTIRGLGRTSLQGDVGFGRVLQSMGAKLSLEPHSISITGAQTLQGIDTDLSGMPDMAQTLAVVALFADGPTTIRGLHTLRVKETDRLAALANELRRLGADVDVHGDEAISIAPPERFNPAWIETYDDHRMAMSFAIAGTQQAGITIKNIECVNKTYPGFFRDLARLSGR
jgi:3-phosphoshikimate 1-carboxyvinyltransferase